MKLHYGGIYKTEEDLKSAREHPEGAVAFREPGQSVFAIIANAGCLILAAGLLAVVWFLARPEPIGFFRSFVIAGIVSVLVIVPHEFLHALCFKEDVYMYFAPSKLMAFVHGTEDMSKGRFVFLSLLPNLVFGVIPFLVFLIDRDLYAAGVIGAVCLSMGFGDYINVFNALTQMPKGAKTYMYGFHSYWYKPD